MCSIPTSEVLLPSNGKWSTHLIISLFVRPYLAHLAVKSWLRSSIYWQPGSLKLPIRVCQPAVLEAWPAAV